MNKDKCILPIYSTDISTYHYHSNILAVIPDGEQKDLWLYNNYIQLEAPAANLDTDYSRLDFYFPYSLWKACPLLFYQRLHRKLIDSEWPDVTKFFIKSISLGFYVYLYADRYYIPNTNSYHRFHHIHDLFIYGYNNTEKMFYAKEYAENTAIYSDTEISYEEMYMAYNSAVECVDPNRINEVELISYDDTNFVRYNLDINYIKNSIKDYLSGSNTYVCYVHNSMWLWRNSSFNFGVNVYNNVRLCLDEIYNGIKSIDFRLLSALESHKNLMLKRIKHLASEGYLRNGKFIYDRYNIINNKTVLFCNLLLKHSLTLNKDFLVRADELFDYITNQEKQVLEYLIQNLTDEKTYYNDMSVQESSFFTSKIVCVKDESIIIDRQVPLENEFPYKYESVSTDIVIDIGDNVIKAVPKETGTYIVKALDINDKVLASYILDCVPVGFKSNLIFNKQHRGIWHKTNDGLIGNGEDNCFYLFKSKYRNFNLCGDLMIYSGDAASFVIRANDELTEFYCANIDATGVVKIWKKTGEWDPSCDLSCDADIEYNKIYQLKVEAFGNSIKLYLDGELKLEYKDSDYQAGYVGVNVFDAKALFQNVNITPIL